MKLTAALFVIVASCAWDQPNQGAFQPVPGAPCGNVGVDCGNHMCCNEGETCGQDSGIGCPAGMCCDVRMPPDFLKYSDAGVHDAGIRTPHPQRQGP